MAVQQSGANVIIRTLITYLLWTVISLFFFPLIAVLLLLPEGVRSKNRLLFRLTSWWSIALMRAAGLTIRVVNVENVPLEPSVVVMNHASALDIPIIDGLFGAAPRIWLSKEYGSVMPLAFILHRMHVMVDTSSAMQAAHGLARLVKAAHASKRHVLLFPEGGRYDDGRIQPFFRGFSLLARTLARPVVPVYIQNAHRVYPKHSVLLRHHHMIEVRVGAPFIQRSGESNVQFAERVRAWFVEQSVS